MRNKKSFTLIELLVVVAIIGLLSTLGVIAFRSAQQKARDTKRLGDVKSVINAFATASQEGMVLKTANCAADWAGGLIKDAEICDTSGGKKTTDYVNLSTIMDPLTKSTILTACSATVVANCQPAINSGKIDNFILYFYTEIPAVGRTANQNGIQ